MDDALGIAFAVAGGPVLLTFANAWIVWRKEKRDNSRQDRVASKAAETAALLIASNKNIASKVSEVADTAADVADKAAVSAADAARTAIDSARAIQTIHILVNSTLTAALAAERDRTRETIQALRRITESAAEGHAANPVDAARLGELISREAELTAQLNDRAVQQKAVDEQQKPRK